VAKTYTAIQKIDVGAGGSSNFTFNSIPATYTDLWLAISSRMLAGGLNGGYASLVFNGDSGSNYGQQWLRGNINTGAVSASDNTTNSYILCLNNSVTNSNTTDVFSSSDIYISSYRSASAKQVSEYHTGAQADSNVWISLSASRWTGSAAITSMVVTGLAGNFGQYSSATLYGISNS
jgi:hypothetical protein